MDTSKLLEQKFEGGFKTSNQVKFNIIVTFGIFKIKAFQHFYKCSLCDRRGAVSLIFNNISRTVENSFRKAYTELFATKADQLRNPPKNERPYLVN